jgi:hypothetical protein
MPSPDDKPSEREVARAPREFDEAALDFARLCLCQSDSYLAKDSDRVFVSPDGYNTGPEAFADREYIDYDDIADVLPTVAYWCSLNTIELKICYFDETYTCTLIEGRPVNQIVETSGSSSLCLELLTGCASIARHMKAINPPRASMKYADFTEGRSET